LAHDQIAADFRKEPAVSSPTIILHLTLAFAGPFLPGPTHQNLSPSSPNFAGSAQSEVATEVICGRQVVEQGGEGQSLSDPSPMDGDGQQSIIVTGRARAPSNDPIEAVNRASFNMVQAADQAFVGPVADGYRKAVPRPMRSGIRNLLRNLQEPVNFVNYLLQIKPGKAAETAGRFALNSTAGVAGLVDVASKPPFKLPRRVNGFGNTLGYYGVRPGAYLYLPLIGPTTVRDLSGRMLDLAVLPVAVGAPFNDPAFVVPTTTIRLLDERAEAGVRAREVHERSEDPFSTVREEYLRRRAREIDALRGKTSAVYTEPAGDNARIEDVSQYKLPAPRGQNSADSDPSWTASRFSEGETSVEQGDPAPSTKSSDAPSDCASEGAGQGTADHRGANHAS
jgi:phospholipid-binding lipoprotein MlaA